MVSDGSVVIETRMNTSQAEKDLAKLKSKIEKAEDNLDEARQKRDAAAQKSLSDKRALDEESRVLEGMKETLKQTEKAKIAGDNLEKARENAKALADKVSVLQSKLGQAQSLSSSQLGVLSVEEGKLAQMQSIRYGYSKEDIANQKKRVSMLASEWAKTDKTVQSYTQKVNGAQVALNNQLQEVAKMQAAGASPVSTETLEATKKSIADQQKRVSMLQAEWNKTQSAVERYDQKIADATTKIEKQKAEAGRLEKRIDAARTPASKLGDAFDGSGISLEKLGKRISNLAKRVFVFSLITAALREMRMWLGKVIKTNDEANAAFARLKGALLTLAQPLVEAVIPALTTLANILTVIITQIARLLSGLSGKTAKQTASAAKGLYEETEALEGVGSAAKEAAGSLAGFDEINTIQTGNAGGGLGGGAGAQMPDFTLDSNISNRLKEIADLVMLIAAGLALWKIGAMLPGVLGTVATILAGILLTVGGLLLAWHGLSDAWENGVSWGNLIESIGGVAAAMLGLYLLFGPIGAGIGGIVGGIALLVTAFHDAMENGWNLQNTLMAIAGLLAAGLGISLLAGSWIPLLVAGIAALLLAFTNATGHGEELLDGIKQIIEGFKDFFVGIFTGDIKKAIGGIEKIIEGLKKTVFAVIDGVKDSFNGFLTWLDEKTGGKLHGIIEFVRGLFNGFFEFVKTTLGSILESVKQIFGGITKFISGVFTNDWDMAWEGVKDIFKGIWNGVIGFLEGAVNLIINGINWLIKQLNKIRFDVPDWVPGIGGKTIGINIPKVTAVSIPRLAQGAVIPPNREFMAVLGDQKSGTNVEAPLETIKQALIEALRESGGMGGGKTRVNLVVDGKTLARVIVPQINDMTRQAGRPVLQF